jgi:hypothetical protein
LSPRKPATAGLKCHVLRDVGGSEKYLRLLAVAMLFAAGEFGALDGIVAIATAAAFGAAEKDEIEGRNDEKEREPKEIHDGKGVRA